MGLSCDEIHVLLCNVEVPADAQVGLVDRACENLFELAEMLTARSLYHALSVNCQAFHIACYQKHADAGGLNGTEHTRGVDSPRAAYPSPGATNSPLGGKDHCSAVGAGVLFDEMASKCLLLMRLFWTTMEEERNLEQTKDSERKKQNKTKQKELVNLRGHGTAY